MNRLDDSRYDMIYLNPEEDMGSIRLQIETNYCVMPIKPAKTEITPEDTVIAYSADHEIQEIGRNTGSPLSGTEENLEEGTQSAEVGLSHSVFDTSAETPSEGPRLVRQQDGFYYCRYCNNCRTTIKKEIIHHERIHVGNCFECPFENCSKRFSRKEHMKRHYISTHTRDKPFQCEVCKKTFARKDHMLHHMRCHLPKRLKCRFCILTFLDKQSLQTHEQIIHNNKPKMIKIELEIKKENHQVQVELDGHRIIDTSLNDSDRIDASLNDSDRIDASLNDSDRIDTSLSDGDRIDTSLNDGDKSFSCRYCSYSSSHRSLVESHETTHTGVGTREQGLGTMERGVGTTQQGIGTTEQGLGTYRGVRTMVQGLGTTEQGVGTMESGVGTMEQGLGTYRSVGTTDCGVGTDAGVGTIDRCVGTNCGMGKNSVDEKLVEGCYVICQKLENGDLEEGGVGGGGREEDGDLNNQDEMDMNEYLLFDSQKPAADEPEEDGPRICEYCDKPFRRRLTLVRHMRHVHMDVPRQECGICQKKFVRRDHLKNHLLSHLNRIERAKRESWKNGSLHMEQDLCESEKKIRDEITRFLERTEVISNLKLRGLKKADDEARVCKSKFVCKFCDLFSCDARSELEAHMEIHTGAKPYQCQYCDKRFSRLQHLHRHGRLHTGVKQFACSQCSRSFYRKDHLDKHVIVHTDEKPYQCTVCDKSFRRKFQLSDHEKVHVKS